MFAEVLLEEFASARSVVLKGAVDTRTVVTHGRDVGAGVALGGGGPGVEGSSSQGRRLLQWAIRAEDGASLYLAESAPLMGDGKSGARSSPRSHAIRVIFPRPLAPMACVVEQEPGGGHPVRAS